MQEDFNGKSKDKPNPSALYRAVVWNDYDEVKALLKASDNDVNEPIDAAKGLCDRPIHAAAYYGFIDVARLLVEAGADLNATGNMGQTPLQDAALNRQASMVLFLVEHGADPGIKNGKISASDLARSNGLFALSEWLDERVEQAGKPGQEASKSPALRPPRQ